MRYFYLYAKYKLRFFEYLIENEFCIPYELSDPKWIGDYSYCVKKYHYYEMEVEDSEYLILKLMFDLKEEI
jgi:hypothetical protein